MKPLPLNKIIELITQSDQSEDKNELITQLIEWKKEHLKFRILQSKEEEKTLLINQILMEELKAKKTIPLLETFNKELIDQLDPKNSLTDQQIIKKEIINNDAKLTKIREEIANITENKTAEIAKNIAEITKTRLDLTKTEDKLREIGAYFWKIILNEFSLKNNPNKWKEYKKLSEPIQSDIQEQIDKIDKTNKEKADWNGIKTVELAKQLKKLSTIIEIEITNQKASEQEIDLLQSEKAIQKFSQLLKNNNLTDLDQQKLQLLKEKLSTINETEIIENIKKELLINEAKIIKDLPETDAIEIKEDLKKLLIINQNETKAEIKELSIKNEQKQQEQLKELVKELLKRKTAEIAKQLKELSTINKAKITVEIKELLKIKTAEIAKSSIIISETEAKKLSTINETEITAKIEELLTIKNDKRQMELDKISLRIDEAEITAKIEELETIKNDKRQMELDKISVRDEAEITAKIKELEELETIKTAEITAKIEELEELSTIKIAEIIEKILETNIAIIINEKAYDAWEFFNKEENISSQSKENIKSIKNNTNNRSNVLLKEREKLEKSLAIINKKQLIKQNIGKLLKEISSNNKVPKTKNLENNKDLKWKEKEALEGLKLIINTLCELLPKAENFITKELKENFQNQIKELQELQLEEFFNLMINDKHLMPKWDELMLLFSQEQFKVAEQNELKNYKNVFLIETAIVEITNEMAITGQNLQVKILEAALPNATSNYNNWAKAAIEKCETLINEANKEYENSKDLKWKIKANLLKSLLDDIKNNIIKDLKRSDIGAILLQINPNYQTQMEAAAEEKKAEEKQKEETKQKEKEEAKKTKATPLDTKSINNTEPLSNWNRDSEPLPTTSTLTM